MKKKIAILGSGSWATALVKIFSENCDQIAWWLHKKETAEFIKLQRTNPFHLKEVKIDLQRVKIYSDINKIIQENDYLILAIPSKFMEEVFSAIEVPFKEKIFISSIKGIIPEIWLSVPDYLTQKHKVSQENIEVISGPCHAEEVAKEKLSFLTISSLKQDDFIFDMLKSSYIRVHFSKDIKGITFATIMKNIYAIASGISYGAGYGDNFQALLVSNCIKEMESILDIISPFPDRNINDSVYSGDLLVTCYSKLSRNRSLGEALGKGLKINDDGVEKMKGAAEGYLGSKGLHNYLKKLKIEMPPIARMVYETLHDDVPIEKAFSNITQNLR